MHFSLFFPLLLITLLCADALVFGFSYGLDRVRIPLPCLILISVVSGMMLSVSFLFGDRLLSLLPSFFRAYLPFFILLLLSLYKIYDSLADLHPPAGRFTSESLSHSINRREIQSLSFGESLLLAITLSVDNISVGLSMGTCRLPIWLLLSYSVFIHAAAILGGWTLGHFFSRRCSHNLSLLSAILLLLLSFAQLR